MDKDHKDYINTMLKHRILKHFYFDKLSKNLVHTYLYDIKVLNRHPLEKPYLAAKDLDDNHPDCFYDAYELSDAVMVRTEASRNLSKANVT